MSLAGLVMVEKWCDMRGVYSVELDNDDVNMLLNAYHEVGQYHLEHHRGLIERYSTDNPDEVDIFYRSRLAALYSIFAMFCGEHPATLDWRYGVRDGIYRLAPMMEAYDRWQERQLGIAGGDDV